MNTSEDTPLVSPQNELDPYIIPQASQQTKTILDLLDSTDSLNSLLHSLAGEIQDPGTGLWVKIPTIEPKINIIGIEAIRLELQRVGKDIYLSNLNEHEIGDMMITLNINLATLFFFRWKDFKLHPKDIANIHWLIMDRIYISFKRAFGEGERKFLKKPISYSETQQIGQPQQSGFKV